MNELESSIKKSIREKENIFEAKKTLKKLSGKTHFIYTTFNIKII